MNWEDSVKEWQDFADLDFNLKQELKELAKDPQALKEAFYAPMEFGTAGMRGVMGPGINRMNIYTVRQATEGLANSFNSCFTLPFARICFRSCGCFRQPRHSNVRV